MALKCKNINYDSKEDLLPVTDLRKLKEKKKEKKGGGWGGGGGGS